MRWGNTNDKILDKIDKIILIILYFGIILFCGYLTALSIVGNSTDYLLHYCNNFILFWLTLGIIANFMIYYILELLFKNNNHY